MIPGYNHNIDYAEKVFHVQTEDSGPTSFSITTDIFIGGNVIESRKQIYCENQESCPPEDELRGIMQNQHKTVMKELVNGAFDALIAERAQFSEQLDGPAPINVEPGQNTASVMISTQSKNAQGLPPPKEISRDEPGHIVLPDNPRNHPHISEESLRDVILRYLSEQD